MSSKIAHVRSLDEEPTRQFSLNSQTEIHRRRHFKVRIYRIDVRDESRVSQQCHPQGFGNIAVSKLGVLTKGGG
jgi:hypothetical protein